MVSISSYISSIIYFGTRTSITVFVFKGVLESSGKDVPLALTLKRCGM